MNIVNKLTVRHLLGNKKRSVVTILGIAVSTSLISAILLGILSFFNYFGELEKIKCGDIIATFSDVTPEQVNLLLNDKNISMVGVIDTDATVSGVRLDNGLEDRFRIGNVAHAGFDYFDQRVVCDYDGTFPSSSDEAAVEAKFLEENNLDLQPGDTLTYEQGYRYIMDGDKLTYTAGAYQSMEGFECLSTETVTVTAILHGNTPTEGYDILRGLDPGFIPPVKDTDVYITLKNPGPDSLRVLKEIVSKYEIDKYDFDSELLISYFAFEGSNGIYKRFFVLMAIALAIVVATSVILIYNSIGMSLTERMRYLGMLASVGATARQKRASIYFEGLILGIVGIPLGLLFGYIGTAVTLRYLGSRMISTGMIMGIKGLKGGVPVVIKPEVVLLIVLLAAVTILISSFTPAIKAARVMPIDALKESNVIKVKARKLRVNPMIRKIFGYEGELAYKNIKRNGIKGKVITFTISVSVILFLSVNYFSDSINRINRYDFSMPCELMVTCSYDERDEVRAMLEETEKVDKVYYADILNYAFNPKPNGGVIVANTAIADPAFRDGKFKEMSLTGFSLVVIDDADFDKLLEDNGLDVSKYHDGTLRAVVLNDLFREKHPSELFNEGIIGQYLRYDKTEGYPPAVEIGDLVKYEKGNYLFELSPKGNAVAFVPASEYYPRAYETIGPDYLTCEFGVETGYHEELAEEIYGMFEDGGYSNYGVFDMVDAFSMMNTVTLMLNTVMFGFTALLTLIAIANIINTISTGIILRRKEFAMYRSVGLTSGGFKKMLRLETFLYGIKALLYGLPVSLALCYLMYSSFNERLFTFNPDWLMFLIVTIVVFLVIALSMALSINKIKDDTIIEALKEDAV